MNESRKSHRVVSRLRCWCEGENVTFYARIGNLSEGGLFLRTATPLASGTPARLRFGSRSLPEVEFAATAIWSREDGASGDRGMGLRFDGVGPGTLQSIRRIVSGEQDGNQATD